MYDELVKQLRTSADWADRLALLMGREEGDTSAPIMRQAADAIEELGARLEAHNEWFAKADKKIEEYKVAYIAEHDARIAEVSKAPRWIPVTERCPEKSGDYLVFDDCRNLYVNEWHYLLKKWQYDDSRITHWMPQPQPPKEET